MEEQKNLNNPPVNQPVADAAPKNIPTATGVLIILSVAVIVGVGIFYFFQANVSENSYNSTAVPDKSLKSQTETAEMLETEESETASQAQVTEEAAAQPAAGANLDFDYELKKLDDQNNSINSDDFNENEMSDANIGL